MFAKKENIFAIFREIVSYLVFYVTKFRIVLFAKSLRNTKERIFAFFGESFQSLETLCITFSLVP